jgi:hypothetical protein
MEESQDFKPDRGNPAVRHYRGASGTVAMVEMRSHLAIERARLVTLHLQQARRSSIPTQCRKAEQQIGQTGNGDRRPERYPARGIKEKASTRRDS